MATQLQLRRGSASQWTTANPTLAEGEPGYETDTAAWKVGDGTTAWTALAYMVAAPTRPTLTAKTADYTLVLGDAWNKIYLSGGTGRSFTVPPNASVSFAVGTEIEVGALGAGALTIVAGAAVTVTVIDGATLVLNGAGAVATLLKTATNTWLLTGQLIAA